MIFLMKEMGNEVLLMIKLRLVEISSGIGGFLTFMFINFPKEISNEMFWRGVIGLCFAAIYAIVGWFIRQKLDNWKKNKEDGKHWRKRFRK